MIESVLRAVAGISAILVGWLLVQALWQRVFAGDGSERLAACAGWRCLACEDPRRCRDPVTAENRSDQSAENRSDQSAENRSDQSAENRSDQSANRTRTRDLSGRGTGNNVN